MLSGQNLVLKPVPDEQLLFERLEKCVKNWFDRFDLFLLHDETLGAESGVTTEIWRDAARPEFELRLVFDDAVPIIYLGVVVDEQADANVLLNDLATCFEVYRHEELLPDALSNPQDVQAWTRLAISLNGQHEERVESSLLTSLASLDADRLTAAAMAAALLGWSSLADPLRAALAQPLPEEVRPRLSLALLACET